MPTVFDDAVDDIARGDIDWINDNDIRALLITGSGSVSKGDSSVTAVLGNTDVDEADNVDNYVRKTLANKVISTTGNKTLFDADNIDWEDLGGTTDETINAMLIYSGTLSSGDDGSNVPIAYLDLSNPTATNGGDFTIQKDATNKWFFFDNT